MLTCDHAMLTLLRVAPFALLLLLGISVVATKWSRLAVNAFIGVFIGASCVAGFAQRDLWPFSPYPVIAESASRWRESVWYEVRAVDGNGVEHPFDASPFTKSTFERSLTRSWPVIPRINTTLVNNALLGPLAAPDSLLARGRVAKDARTLRIYRHDVNGTALVREYAAR
jgi:hypothetical protein